MDSQQLVGLVTNLFLLSVVSERISNFLKLYLPECIFRKEVYLRTKKDTETQEKERERNILFVTLLSGITLAFLADANLFSLLTGKHEMGTLGKSLEGMSVGKYILGCLLAGVFASMGSKFWHDMLDIVLAIKNLKQARTTQIEEETPKEQDVILKIPDEANP